MTPLSEKIDSDDLVLAVRQDFDPTKLRLHLYEAFLDALCGDREYQKDAIRTVCRFLGGGLYDSTRDLATENAATKPELLAHYGSLSNLHQALPFPDKLACCVDLATATGKSWVMYGIARILLAEGIVDRVLVLCPSLTIEAALREKFTRLTANGTLTELIPLGATFSVPEITDANSTTGPGDICIENIDATYRHVRSSVRDSFYQKGDTTLILNDETHHVFSPPTGGTSLKRWKEFLNNIDLAFRRIVGLSGTSYLGDTYFPDVVSRYSLRQAMEDGRAKTVYYVAKDESSNEREKFQKYVQVHEENRKRHPELKPLTIVVTAKIEDAQQLAARFSSFLTTHLTIPATQAEDRILIVTSKHPANVARLQEVDRLDTPVEWIFSVSMLTEGWDVQNVFQIIPHEKRAFNSKLLIAQVLGRGLRIPATSSKPVVRVFNHSSWSSEIQSLVDDVLEQEHRLRSYPVEAAPRSSYHFLLYTLTYETTTKVIELKSKNGHVNLFKRGYVHFESQPAVLERHTTFAGVLEGAKEYVVTTAIRHTAYSVDEAVQRLRARLKSIDVEGGTSYAKTYTVTKLRHILEASLSRIGETRALVSEQNLQHSLRALGNTQRKEAKTVRLEYKPKMLQTVSTHDMRPRSSPQSAFRKEATVFYDSVSATLSEESDQSLLAELKDDTSPYPRQAAMEVKNSFWFKTPVNVVLTTHGPERSFVQQLFSAELATRLDAWIKSPDVGFYEIQYSWRRGDHTKHGKFNPDIFIKLTGSNDVIVVELKDDDDVTDENRAKMRFAREHFERVNVAQMNARYRLMFISPESYDKFFQAIKDGTAMTFVSALEARLSE